MGLSDPEILDRINIEDRSSRLMRIIEPNNIPEKNLNPLIILLDWIVMTSYRPLHKNWKRIREVVNVAVKYGFLKTIVKLDLKSLIAMRPQTQEIEGDHAVRVRKMLEELGPSYVKIGQTLSMRPDLIPKSFVDEFAKLYDSAEPFPFSDVKSTIEGELNRKLTDIFRSIEEKPIAAASMGQVHRAVLKDGTNVAVKVRRPGIDETIRSDIAEVIDRGVFTLVLVDG